MAEVLEHLYTNPTQVLRFVRSVMAPGGCLLLQTPNAATLKKRMKLLRGANPYEMIRENRDNPGHFREYTRTELTAAAETAGFDVMAVRLSNYHSHDSSKSAFSRVVRAALSYPNFRRGITMTLKNPAQPGPLPERARGTGGATSTDEDPCCERAARSGMITLDRFTGLPGRKLARC